MQLYNVKGGKEKKNQTQDNIYVLLKRKTKELGVKALCGRPSQN